MDRVTPQQVVALGSMVGLGAVGVALVVIGGGHYVTFGASTLPAVAVGAGAALLFGSTYLLGSDVSPVSYPFVLGATVAGTLAFGGGTALLFAVTGSTVTFRAQGAVLGALAGAGSLAGFVVGIQSARVRDARSRADHAATIAERLSEERGRFAVLNETTRNLLDAPDRETVANRLVEDGRVGFPGPFAGVWLHEPDRERLVPSATTSTAADWEPQQLWPDSEAMAVFESGEPATITGDEFPNVGVLYALPLGTHGLLVVGASQGFDEKARDIAAVYARTAEAAMDRIEREEQLQRQNERLESFASIVTHDLRNPLNVVRGRAELVKKTGDVSHLESIFRSLDRMDTIIGDVLALAQGGQGDLETESVNLLELVERSWEQVDTKDAELEMGFLQTVEADPDRLARLFENLFRNSVEHGSTGSRPQADDSVEHGGDDVTVSVSMLEAADGFYVADDGPGIPVDERNEVLAEGYTTNDGTGIGLAIVRQVADGHGWSIEVTESESGGARFEFRF